MPVTEFALIKLRPGYDALEFLETCMENQEIQDAWVRQHQSHNVNTDANLSCMYTEIADTPSLAITAPWDSPEAHGEWIQSVENQQAMGKMAPFIAPGSDSVLLFHMEAAGRRNQMRTAFKHKDGNDGFDICRITIPTDQKEALQSQYQALEEQLRSEGLENSIWAGWRIEKLEAGEDLILFWSNDIDKSRMKDFFGAYNKRDHRRFRHLV